MRLFKKYTVYFAHRVQLSSLSARHLPTPKVWYMTNNLDKQHGKTAKAKLTTVGILERLDMLPARLGAFHMFMPPE